MSDTSLDEACNLKEERCSYPYLTCRTSTCSQVLYVTGTTRRPVPLEHSLYFAGQLYPICRGDTLLPEVSGLIVYYCFV